MRVMRALVGPVHPGMRYLLDMAVVEAARPEQQASSADVFDWTGTSTLEGVVEQWAAQAAVLPEA